MKTPRKSLQLSPSQIDSYIQAPRKWWLKSVHKIPEPPRKATTLGDVGHNVCGNFLEGKEMYPKGWEQARNRWTNEEQGAPLTTGEQSLVQALIHNGIHSGTLLKEPDGVVEQEIELALDIESPFPKGVKIKMFLDYATQHSVQDHKFCKATRYYSKDKLVKATPMLLYAYAQFVTGNCTDDTIWLRYNLFVKDPQNPSTKTVEVEVTRVFVMNWFETVILPTVNEMIALYLREVPKDEWFKVACAEDKRDACTAYGGCPFLPICSGQMSVEAYQEAHRKKDSKEILEKETAMLEGLRQATDNNTTGDAGEKKERKDMTVPNFRQQLLAKRKAEAAGATAGTTEEIKPSTQEPGPAVVVEDGEPVMGKLKVAPTGDEPLVAPWHNSKCPACKDNPIGGFNSKGQVCTVCNALNKREGLKQATDFVVQTEEDGSILVIDPESGDLLLDTGAPKVREGQAVIAPAEEKPEPKPEPKAKKEKVEKPVKKEKAEKPVKKEKAEPKPEPETPKDEGTDEEGTSLDPKELKEQYVQERTGFTLSYAAVRQKKRISRKLGDSNCVVHIGELVETIAPHMLEAHNEACGEAASYYEINPFARRDLIASNAQAIAEVLGNSILEADTVQKATDEAHICAAIERFAVAVFGEMV